MPSQPNILFMIADDHRFDAIGAMGDATVQTPVLDSLMARGTTFRQTHIMGSLVGAVCVPSRAAVLTSANLFRSGMQEINRELAVWPQVMREAGYHTFATGKWHNDKQTFTNSFAEGAKIFFGGMSSHFEVPVFDYDASGAYPNTAKYIGEKFSTEMFTDEAVQFLQNYDASAPFFPLSGVHFTARPEKRRPANTRRCMRRRRCLSRKTSCQSIRLTTARCASETKCWHRFRARRKSCSNTSPTITG